MADITIRERVADYYSEKVRQHGETARGVDWNSTESQRTRFDQLLGIVPSGALEYSILDYGCGYGAIIEMLTERGQPFHYLGYDVSQEMILRAGRLHVGSHCQFTTVVEELSSTSRTSPSWSCGAGMIRMMDLFKSSSR